jgi:hypothetical protein
VRGRGAEARYLFGRQKSTAGALLVLLDAAGRIAVLRLETPVLRELKHFMQEGLHSIRCCRGRAHLMVQTQDILSADIANHCAPKFGAYMQPQIPPILFDRSRLFTCLGPFRKIAIAQFVDGQIGAAAIARGGRIFAAGDRSPQFDRLVARLVGRDLAVPTMVNHLCAPRNAYFRMYTRAPAGVTLQPKPRTSPSHT